MTHAESPFESYVGHQWIQDREVQDIIVGVGLELSRRSGTSLVRQHVQEIIREAVAQQLRSLVDERSLRRARSHVAVARSLHRDIRAWRAKGLPLSELSCAEEEFVRLDEQLNQISETRVSGQTRAWADVFFPRMLGLFAAAFGRLPRASGDAIADRYSPAVQFLRLTIEHVRAEQLRCNLRKELRWLPQSGDSVRRKASDWLQSGEWVRWRDFYKNSHLVGIW